MALTILCVSFIVFLLIGVPVAFAIGLSALCTILYEGLPFIVIFQRMMSGMNVFSFLAIPFFIFAGELMLYGGIADKIVVFAKNLVGHVRGGLGMSNVVACTLFGGISGSPVADVSAMGSVMIPMMKKEGYDADYAVNVTDACVAGRRADADQSQHDHLLARRRRQGLDRRTDPRRRHANGGACDLHARRRLPGGRAPRLPGRRFPGWNAVLRSAAAAIPGLFVAVIIIVGILSGVFTATESASVAVLYAMFVTVVLYRTMSRKNFLKASAKAVKTTGVVLLLIGVSATFQYSDRPLPGRRPDRRMDGEGVVGSLGDLPADQLDPLRSRHVHGHGEHDPDLHADFPADRRHLRNGSRAIRYRDARQLRARPQHATGRHHAVRRLRDRRSLGWPCDAHDLAVLRRADGRAPRRDLCAGFSMWLPRFVSAYQ